MGRIKGWKRSQTGSGYYQKYPWGIKTVKIKPQDSIYKPYKIVYHDSGSGTGHTISSHKTLEKARTEMIKWLRKNPYGVSF